MFDLSFTCPSQQGARQSSLRAGPGNRTVIASCRLGTELAKAEFQALVSVSLKFGQRKQPNQTRGQPGRLGNRETPVFVSSDDPEKLLLVVLGLTLLVAGLAQQLQVSAAVGAFLVGIALSGEVAEGTHNLLAPLRDLLAAVFFVFFGHRVLGPEAGRDLGQGPVASGGTLVARGEFSIVIAGLAVTAGIEPSLGPLATAYVLIL